MDGVTDDPVVALRVAGQRLVDALRDQVADGQVETLLTLQTAATALQRQSTEVAGSVAAMTGDVLAEVAAGVEALLQELLATLGERVAEETDETTRSLTRSAEKVAKQLSGAEKALRTVTELATGRAEQVRLALEAATAALAAQADRTEAAFDRAGAALEERLRATALEAEERIATATDAAVQALRVVGVETERQLAAARVEADATLDEHLAALKTQLAAQVRRDGTVAARLQQQVEALVERTDATAGRTVELLQQAVSDLQERDRALEQDRAEAFVRVLDALLPAERPKRLRSAVRDGLTTHTRRGTTEHEGERS